MPVRHFYLLPHYSCNGLFFLFSVCWLHVNEFNSFLGGIKGEKSEGYCLLEICIVQKIIFSLLTSSKCNAWHTSRQTIYHDNIMINLLCTVIELSFYHHWQHREDNIRISHVLLTSPPSLSHILLVSIPSGAKTQKKEIIPYLRCGFGACLRCG